MVANFVQSFKERYMERLRQMGIEPTPIYYKVTGTDGEAVHGGSGKWPLPTQQEDGSWEPGAWTEPIEEPIVCLCGYHLIERTTDSHAEHVLHWLMEAADNNLSVWVVEWDGKYDASEKVQHGKIAVERARLLRPALTDSQMRSFACDCADRVIHKWEGENISKAPRDAIQAARLVAGGRSDMEEWMRDVGHMAAEAGGKPYVKGKAMQYAAYAAGSTACRYASEAMVDAAMHAKWAVYYSKSENVGSLTLRGDEADWQVARLADYLDGKILPAPLGAPVEWVDEEVSE